MKIILSDKPGGVDVCYPSAWIMAALTSGGIGKLPGDAVTADLGENVVERIEVSESMPKARAVENMLRNGRSPAFVDKYLTALMAGGETDATALELVREHAFKDKTGQVAVEHTDIPADRAFRDAWRLQSGVITIDLAASRTLFVHRFVAWKAATIKDLAAQIEMKVLLGEVSDALESQHAALTSMSMRTLGDALAAAKSPDELRVIKPEIFA